VIYRFFRSFPDAGESGCVQALLLEIHQLIASGALHVVGKGNDPRLLKAFGKLFRTILIATDRRNTT
jgi:hypothetical protein